MAISRMQQPRQLYGLGSFVKKVTRKVTKPITKVASKIVQGLTRPSQEYDLPTAEAQTRDLDGIIQKLNTTYQQELKDEVEAQNFFLN